MPRHALGVVAERAGEEIGGACREDVCETGGEGKLADAEQRPLWAQAGRPLCARGSEGSRGEAVVDASWLAGGRDQHVGEVDRELFAKEANTAVDALPDKESQA